MHERAKRVKRPKVGSAVIMRAKRAAKPAEIFFCCIGNNE